MAAALFCLNQCQFDNCGLHFATLYDLIQHIEETHISNVETEKIRARDEGKTSPTPQASPAEGGPKNNSLPMGPALPLSRIYRIFPILPTHKAQPIKYEPTKISFFHYRKKQVPLQSVGSLHYAQQNFVDKSRTTSRSGISEHDEEMSNDSFRTNDDDGDTYEPTDDRRHKCPVEGCNKRYKNLQGARYHARTVHGVNEDTSATLAAVDVMSAASGSQSPLTPTAPTSKAAAIRPFKCSQCSKRYKTTSNLNKHVQETHQRVNSNYSTQSVIPNLSPVSPAAMPGSISSPLFQNSTSQDSPLIQGPVAMGTNQVASGPLPGVRITAQPVQSTVPQGTVGYHYHQPNSYSTTNASSSAIQVRTVSAGNSRSNTNSGPIITYGNMVDGSQQTDTSMQMMQQRQQHRLSLVGNQNVPLRNQYSTNNQG